MVLEQVNRDVPATPGKKKKESIRVVKELPMQPVNVLETDDEIIHLITLEEWATQQINQGSD